MTSVQRCFNVHDLRDLARRRLPRGIFEYIDKGTEEGVALAENRAGFDRIRLHTRFMVDLTDVDLSTTLFGAPVAMPLGIAPTGIPGLCAHHGEVVLAQAARDAGIPFTLADPSITPMELVAEVGGRLWFQSYLWDETDLSHAMIDRAHRLGFEALVVTIDSGLGRIREHNERNGFAFPFRPNTRALLDMARHPRWLVDVLLRTTIQGGPPRNAIYPPQYQQIVDWRGTAPTPRRFTAMTWEDVAHLRTLWPRTLIVKSILTAEDARKAVDHGADGIVVSNHGGRSMDSARATIDALPDIVDAVGDRTTVILDSGIRRGSDIVKALALGADFTMTGRATLYGLAAGGRTGVDRALGILASEYEKTLGYIGSRNVAEITTEVVAGTTGG